MYMHAHTHTRFKNFHYTLLVVLTKRTTEYIIITVINPSNGELVGAVPDMNEADVETAIQSAYRAFQTWKKTTAKVRKMLKHYQPLNLNPFRYVRICVNCVTHTSGYK